MENNFDLRKFLTENKLTTNSRVNEDYDSPPESDISQEEYEDEVNSEITKMLNNSRIAELIIEAIDKIDNSLIEDINQVSELSIWVSNESSELLQNKLQSLYLRGSNPEDAAEDLINSVIADNINGIIEDIKNNTNGSKLQMENNFDLRKFLTENKLTANSKILNENENALPDYEEADYPVAQAFEKAGVDMSRPIHVMYYADRWVEKDLGEKDPKQFAAELEGERQAVIKDLESYANYMPVYEYENNTVYPVPDGLEYKLCFAVFESHDYAILQAASEMNEEGYMDEKQKISNSARKEIEDVIMNYSEYEGRKSKASLAPDLFGEAIIDALEAEGINVPKGGFNRKMEDALEGLVLDLESGEDIDRLVDDAIEIVTNPAHYGNEMNEMHGEGSVERFVKELYKIKGLKMNDKDSDIDFLKNLGPEDVGEVISVLNDKGINFDMNQLMQAGAKAGFRPRKLSNDITNWGSQK